MPQIYTKDEIDKLLADLKKLIERHDMEHAAVNQSILKKIETNYNELFSFTNDNKNRIDKFDQDLKAKDKPVKSPYAR